MTRSTFRRSLLLGCALALTVATQAMGRSSGRLVEIHVEGDDLAVEKVRLVATELLSGVSMAPVVLSGTAAAPRYSSSAEPFVRAYFDFRSAPPALVILDGSTSRELERRSLPENAELEASVESATHVLLMVVESMHDEQALVPEAAPPLATEHTAHGAATPEQAPAAPPSDATEVVAPPLLAPETDQIEEPEPASASGERAVELDLGLVGRAIYFGEGWLLPGAGAGVDLRFERVRPVFGVSTTFAVHSPITLSYSGAAAKLSPLSLVLVPTVQADVATNTRALFGIGAGLTWFSLRTRGAPGVSAGDSAGGVDPMLTGVVGLRVLLSSRVSLTMSGAFDYDPNPREFVAMQGSERVVLAALPAFRPSLNLLAAYSLLGRSNSSRPQEAK